MPLVSRLACAGVLMLLTACSHGAKQFKFRVEPNPPRVGRATFYFHVPEATGTVTMEGYMAHPGMAPVSGQVEAVGEGGEYKGRLDLNMPGDWIIGVKAKSADGSIIEQQFPITVSEK